MILYFIWITVPALSYGKCFDGWNEFQGKCVKIFNEDPPNTELQGKVNWFDVRDHCASINAYLARIDNAEMNEWITGLTTWPLWIGANDIENEGVWVDTKGEPWTYFSWKTQEPNGGSGENCVNTHQHGLQTKWNDLQCEIKLVHHAWACMMDATVETKCDLTIQTPSLMGMVKVAQGQENLEKVHFNVDGMTDLHILLSRDNPATNDESTIEIIMGHRNGECIDSKATGKCWLSRSYIRRGIGNTENAVKVDHTDWQFHMWRQNMELRITSNSVALYNEFDKVIIELTAIDTTELNHLFVFSGGDGETTWQINPNQCLPLVVEDDPAEYPSTWHIKYQCVDADPGGQSLTSNGIWCGHLDGAKIKIQDAYHGDLDKTILLNGNWNTDICKISTKGQFPEYDLTKDFAKVCDGKENCNLSGPSLVADKERYTVKTHTRVKYMCYHESTDFAVRRGHIYGKLRKLYPDWHLTIDIKPLGLVYGMGSVLHASIGGVIDNHGDRTPDIWFYPNDTRLHVATSLNQFQNWWQEIPAIPMNEWTRVEVSQLGGKYEIRTGGKVRYQAENHSYRTFNDVKLFTAHDHEYVIANARVDNIEMNTWETLFGQNANPPQENVPVKVAQCGRRYEIDDNYPSSAKTAIQFPELMERVRFRTKNLGPIRILITEFDKGHMETRGRRCYIHLGDEEIIQLKIECIEADGFKSLNRDFSDQIVDMEAMKEHFEVSMGFDPVFGEFLRVGQFEMRSIDGFNLDKLHYLSIKSDGASRWIVSGGSCAAESSESLDWLDDLGNPCDDSDACAEGWQCFEAKCVKIFDHESEGLPHHLNWFEAKEHCASVGAYLARIDTTEMNEWITSLSTHAFWIGANDLNNENQWVDVFGQDLSFTSWNAGEPSGGNQVVREHCAHTHQHSPTKWNDNNCYGIQFFWACMYDAGNPGEVRGFTIKEGVYKVLPILYKQWRLEFEFIPQTVVERDPIASWYLPSQTLLHAWDSNTDRKKGDKPFTNWDFYGGQIPRIATRPGNRIYVTYAFNGKAHQIDMGGGPHAEFNPEPNEPSTGDWPVNQWVKFQMNQVKQSDGTYLVTIKINGKVYFQDVNMGAKVFKNVKVGVMYKPASTRMDNLIFETWPDNVELKPTNMKTLGGCKELNVNQPRELENMLCKRECETRTVDANQAKQQWVMNTKQTLILQIKIKPKEVATGEPFVGFVRFDRKDCAHDILKSIESHGSVRFEIQSADVNGSKTLWTESITYLADIGEKWGKTALYIQFRRWEFTIPELKSQIDVEKTNAFLLIFNNFDSSMFPQEALQTCLSSAKVEIMQDDGSQPAANDYTRCAAFNRYRLDKNWQETDFVPKIDFTDSKADSFIGGCKSGATYGRENGNKLCENDCAMIDQRLLITPYLNSADTIMSDAKILVTFSENPVNPIHRKRPYIGIIRMEKEFCGETLLNEIEKRGAIRFDVGDNALPDEDDQYKYFMDSITYPTVNGARDALFVQFRRTGWDKDELEQESREKFYTLMKIYSREKMNVLGITFEQVRQCMDHMVLQTVQYSTQQTNYNDRELRKFVYNAQDYTLCAAHRFYDVGIDYDWSHSFLPDFA